VTFPQCLIPTRRSQTRSSALLLYSYKALVLEVQAGSGAWTQVRRTQNETGSMYVHVAFMDMNLTRSSTRTCSYMLATELHGHLDDLSASLTQMIESVNALSPSGTSSSASMPSPSASTNDPAATLSLSALGPSTSTASNAANDDPLTQIAQVLANHLESLQWIDGAVREVEAKVTDVERRVRSAAGDASPGALGAGSPRVPGSIGPGGGVRGVGGIGADYGSRFGR
jgi:hypothetical protein